MENKGTVLEMMKRCLSKTAYNKFERNFFLNEWPADKPAKLPPHREVARHFLWSHSKEGFAYWDRQRDRLLKKYN